MTHAGGLAGEMPWNDRVRLEFRGFYNEGGKMRISHFRSIALRERTQRSSWYFDKHLGFTACATFSEDLNLRRLSDSEFERSSHAGRNIKGWGL